MANAALPTVQGTTLDGKDIKEIFVNQLAGITKLLEVSEKNLEISKDTLDIIKKGNKDTDVLEDIRDLLATISHNILTGLVATLEPAAMDLLQTGKTSRLEAREKEKEADKLKGEKEKEDEDKEEKDNGILSFLKNLVTIVLIPLIVGFWIGLTKKFNILTIALSALTVAMIRHPIKTLNFLWDTLKSLKTSLAKFAVGFKNLFADSKVISYIRSKFFGTMLAVFMKIESILQGERISGAVTYIKGILAKASKTINAVKGFIKPVIEFFQTVFEPITKAFSAGAKLKGLANNKALGWLMRVGSKGLKAIPVIGWIITAVEGLFGAVTGGIEGFKKDGFTGMIKGALVGLVDGLIGWIVDIGQWIVSGLLDLFGFDDAAKVVEKFNFKEFLDKYMGFFMPIVGLIDLFDENSEMRKRIASGIEAMKNFDPSDFFVNLGEVLMEMIKRIAESMPGGKALLKFLGIKPKTEKTSTPSYEVAKDKNVAAAQARLDKAGVAEAAEAIADSDTKEAKSILMEKFGFPEERANEILGISKPAPVPSPAPNSPQLAGSAELQAQTDKYKDLAAAPPKPKPVSPMTNVAIDASSKQSVTYQKELHAQKQRGSPGQNYRSVV